MKTEYLLRSTAVRNRTFPIGSVILYLENGMVLVSNDFRHKRTQKLEMYCYLPKQGKWVLTHDKNDLTEEIWNCYRKNHIKYKRKESFHTYKHMMKHDRKHKRGSGGQRLGFSGTVTDYECCKEPIHDFRRVYN